jgi:isoleucyl-tRNA synthetase
MTEETVDYRQTLNLPTTAFPMRANLAELEPRIQRFWQEIDLYGAIQRRMKGRPQYILHDGPPFPNADIHIGQALNKVLKDVVVKFKTMRGFDCPYVPGWDTHGLPTEIAAIKTFDIDRHAIAPMELRARSRETALHYINVQRGQFRRLGVRGDWEHPYLTLDPQYEGAVIEAFAKFVEKGCVNRGLMPVHWCPECETALADAELEYKEHTSLSVYLRFPVISLPRGVLPGGPAVGPVSFAVWTTTPWTLPASAAVAVHPGLEYVLVRTPEEHLVLARGLLERVMADLGISAYEVVSTAPGSALEGARLRHPFVERELPVVLADYVTLEQGTGCVHTAPGHGREDFITGRKYGLPTYQPLDQQGVFTDEGGQFAGLSHTAADPKILEELRRRGALMKVEHYSHQYPHCWRCETPVIFRATRQWFVDLKPFTQQALAAVDAITWVPPWGQQRIRGMIAERPDWCISRQRVWGIPIPALYCSDCGHELLDLRVIERARQIISTDGSDAWHTTGIEDLLPSGTKCSQCGSFRFEREQNIFDVWFESGSSHAAVLKTRPELRWPSDLYLEGHDQYRGWFQLSLWNALIAHGHAPYRTVLTNGFVLDENGRKMSKRLGNVIDPQDVARDFGAEIFRLWVSYVDFKEDMPTGPGIFDQVVDGYRRLRNTLRFLLANLYDFHPDSQSLPPGQMREVDRWILHRLSRLQDRLTGAYDEFEFHQVYYRVHEFCAVDLSQVYLDLLKDRLYTYPPDSLDRRSAQTALWVLATTLAKVLTPILSHTTEEVWQHLPAWPGKELTVQMCAWPEAEAWRDEDLAGRWEREIVPYFAAADLAVERLRQGRVVRQPMEAELVVYSAPERWQALLAALGEDDLAAANGVSAVTYGGRVEQAPGEAVEAQAVGREGGVGEPMRIWGRRSQARKCARCWRHQESVGSTVEHSDLCGRCVEYVTGHPAS